MKPFVFSDIERETLERVSVPLCAYEWAGWGFRLLAMSDGYAAMLGMMREEIVDGNGGLRVKVHPDDVASLESAKKSIVQHPGSIYPMTFRVQKRDGTYILVKAQARARKIEIPAEKNENKRLADDFADYDEESVKFDEHTIYYVTYSDATAEEEMRLSQERVKKRSSLLLEKVLATTQVAIFWKDAQRRFMGVNQAFLDYYGFPSAQVLLGKTDEDMGWNIEEEKFKQDEERVLRGETIKRAFGHCVSRGEVRDIVASKSPVYEDGRIVGLVGSFDDVTNERRSNSQNERLLHALDYVPAGLCLYECEGQSVRCLMMNRYFGTMTGITREALEKRPYDAILPFVLPQDRDIFRKSLQAIIADGKNFSCTVRIQRAFGGYAYVHVIGVRVRDGVADRIYLSFADVTKSRQLQAMRRAERVVMERALSMAHVLVWEFDMKTQTIHFMRSETADSMRESIHLPERIGPMPEAYLDWIGIKDRKKYIEHYRKVLLGESGTVDLHVHIPGSDNVRIERLTHVVLRDSQGKAYSAYGMSQNITEQKKLERMYLDEQKSLGSAAPKNLVARGHYNLTRNWVMEHSMRDERVLDIKTGSTYDLAVEAMLSTVVEDHKREKIAEMLDRQKLIARYHEGKRTFSMDFKHAKKGNFIFWAMISVSTYEIQSGDIEAFIYIYDVTLSLLRHEIITKLSELGYDDIGIIDYERGIIFAFDESLDDTEAIGRANDYEELLEASIEAHCPEEDKSEARAALSIEKLREKVRSYSESDKAAIYDYSYDYIDGNEMRRKRVQFCYLGKYTGMIFYCRSDITSPYKKGKEQMRRLEEALEAAERANESKTMFLASISHDMRTPLNGILGFTRLAIGSDDIVKQKDYLQKIMFSGSLLLSLVNDTLSLSRLESGKYVLQPEEVSWSELIDGVVVPISVSAQEKGADFVTLFDKPPMAKVRIDRLKFQEIILNLLSNAVKFTPRGGKITFKIEFFDVNDKTARGGCNTRITVRDTGVGVSAEFIPKIFEPFSQERNEKTQNIAGTGLGLAIVKRIIERMDGRVSVTSELDKGTEFVVELPIDFIDGATDGERFDEQEVDFIGKRVLLVEDNFLNTEIAKTLLEEKGITVDTAADGEIAVSMFRESPWNTYNVVLMDIRMPKMDGYQATREIRRLERPDAKKTPIIAMTADAYAEDIKRCIDVGMQDHIAKPIDPIKMFQSLAKWVK